MRELDISSMLETCKKRDLEDFCSKLGLQHRGSKLALKSRISSYCASPSFDSSRWSACFSSIPTVDCICFDSYSYSQKPTKKCEKCGKLSHTSCIVKAASMQPFECPRCQIERMDPFFPVVAMLTPPTRVRGLSLGIEPKDYAKIEKVGNRLSSEGGYIVQVRCLRLDELGYTHAWPGEMVMTLNSKQVRELKTDPRHASRKRKDYPFDFGLAEHDSTIGIWKRRDSLEYAFAVVLTKKRTAEEVLTEMRSGEAVTAAAGRQRVMRAFEGSDDLKMETIRMTVVCPLSRMVMDMPGRGWKCNHLQCFDIPTFIALQEDTTFNKWKCPLCRLPCPRLCPDLFIAGILQSSPLTRCQVIEFAADGDYSLIESDEKMHEVSQTSLGGLKRKSESQASCSGKIPKITISPDSQEPLRFSWSDFLHHRISSDQVYTCEIYSKLAQVTAPQLWKQLELPRDTPLPRTSIGSLSTVRVSLGCRMTEGRSKVCPIDLEN